MGEGQEHMQLDGRMAASDRLLQTIVKAPCRALSVALWFKGVQLVQRASEPCPSARTRMCAGCAPRPPSQRGSLTTSHAMMAGSSRYATPVHCTTYIVQPCNDRAPGRACLLCARAYVGPTCLLVRAHPMIMSCTAFR